MPMQIDTSRENVLEVVVLDDSFYWNSGTAMSATYIDHPENGWVRGDWALIPRLVRENGYILVLRQPTPEELAYFQQQLIEHMERNRE